MAAQSTRIDVPEGVQSPRGKLVYLALATSEGATVDELQSALSMSKLTLYSVLRTLVERDVIQETRGGYVVG